MQIGRNEPCHCGSGVKYKKCCLEKDSQIVHRSDSKFDADDWEREDEPEYDEASSDWNEDEPDYDENESEDEDEPEDEGDDYFDTLYTGLQGNNNANIDSTKLPDLSEEDEKLVDDWWDEYRKMQDTVRERQHLITFIDKYPHLVDHLGLYYEVLFELGADHYKKGIYATFVELLLRIRKEFPWTYQQSFAFYDNDLIFWYTSQGRVDEINEFFNFFKEKGDYDGKLNDLNLFFQAINRPDLIIAGLSGENNKNQQIADIVSWSRSVAFLQKHIDEPVSDESILSLSAKFVAEGFEEEEYQPENLKKNLLSYTRPFTPWDTNLPKKRSQADKYYFEIIRNYAYFLHKNCKLSFSSAIAYSDCISDYYQLIVVNNKRPNDIFALDADNIKKMVNRNSNIFWGCEMKGFVMLNALYYFVAYLHTCGNMPEDRKNVLQKSIKDIFQQTYDVSKNQGPEMLLFEKFPLWGIL